MQWYYSQNGSQSGPIDDVELQRLIASGSISPHDLLWNHMMGDQWQTASSLTQLSPLFASRENQASLATEVISSNHHGNGMTPNRDLMRMARESLKGRWGMAVVAHLIYLGILLLVILPEIAIQVPYQIKAQQAQMQAIAAAHQAHQAVPATLHSKVDIPRVISLIAAVFKLLQFLISAPLMVGLVTFFLKIARGQEPRLSDIFRAFSIFWKSVGTYFLMGLLAVGWVLLFCAPAIGLFIWSTISHQTGNHLLMDGIFLVAAVGYIAAFIKIMSYMLSFMALADEPTLGPLQAIKRSKLVMEGRKWKFFCLCLRFLGWMLLSLLTCGIGMLWVIPYQTTAMAHFYLDVKDRSTFSDPAIG